MYHYRAAVFATCFLFFFLFFPSEDMPGAQPGGKGKGAGRARSKCKGASSAPSNSTTDMRPSAAVQTATSVPPPPPGSPLRAAASMTLASMSLTAPTTPVLTSGTASEVQDLTGSDKGVVTVAEINAGVHTEDMTRKLKDSERKKKERSAAAAAKLIQGESSTSASTLMPQRCSPRKSSPEKSLRAGAAAVVNWSSSDDVRMVLVACCPQIQKLFELLGHPSNRGELEGSNSATDARPSTAFYEKLAEIFSDSAFKGAVPAEWPRDEHLPVTKLYALRQERDGAWMKDKWRSLGVRHEVAWRRYSGVSGTDGYSCFCGCGKVGFWTTSGFGASHANKLSSDAITDQHGDRKCVAPSPHLGVYVWSEQEHQREQACRKQLLSSLQSAGSKDSNSEADEISDDDD